MSASVRYGGFWRRLAASALDAAILQVLYLCLLLLAFAAGLSGFTFAQKEMTPEILGRQAAGLFALYWIFCIIVHGVFYTFFHGCTGQTPGKMALKLRVVLVTGDPMTFGVAFLRWVGYAFSALPFGLGYLWAAFDPRKQGWHDKIAGTLVLVETSAPVDPGAAAADKDSEGSNAGAQTPTI